MSTASPAPLRAVPLAERGLLRLAGPDRVAFLQGLVSNDVRQVGPARAVWAAFLTPQGKYLHDFIMLEDGESLLLDCEADRREDLLRRLRLYRLRSKVELADATADLRVVALVGAGAAAAAGLPETEGAATGFGGGIACVDPRHRDLGVRLVLACTAAGPDIPEAPHAVWDLIRLELGVPDGSCDLVPEKSILLENGFDAFHGVSWDKGCFMGQELTARTKYRALIKKRLMPVIVDGPLPAPGTPVLRGEREVGEFRSGNGDRGLALLRLEELDADGPPLLASGTRLMPRPAQSNA